jgi:hypothetical protein
MWPPRKLSRGLLRLLWRAIEKLRESGPAKEIEMTALAVFTFVELLEFVTGVIAYNIAEKKGRSGFEGFWIGFFLSIPGVIIELILPRGVQREIKRDGGKLTMDRPNNPLRDCPFCAAMVLADAPFCRFCGRDLPAVKEVSFVGNRLWRDKKKIAR